MSSRFLHRVSSYSSKLDTWLSLISNFLLATVLPSLSQQINLGLDLPNVAWSSVRLFEHRCTFRIGRLDQNR